MKLKILLVDDETENLKLLQEILKEEYRLMFAKNGTDALVLATQEPDLILLDIMMPAMDGYTVCQKLKQNDKTKDIPVIFVTAKRDVADELVGLELGAVDYITKPVSPPLLKARVKTHLHLHSAKQAITAQNAILEETVRERTSELRTTQWEIIRCLGQAAEYRDNETSLHVTRMSHYAKMIGVAIGLPERDTDLLLQAAPLHDIGKIGIPDPILRKPGRLTAEEWVIMKQHPEIGAKIIGNHPAPLLATARTIAWTHHEKWDGSGYPRGLQAEEIPLVGRITAIADVFDALTTKRPYKEAFSVEEATNIMKKDAGSHFEWRLLDRFLAILPEIIATMQRYHDAQA